VSVVYALEEALASSGPWTAVVGSPFSSTTDVVSGLNASTAYFFRITAKDTLFNISAPPTVVGPIVTNSSFLVESPQNTRINQASASTVPPVGTITSSGSTASSLGLVWSLPVAIYDAGLNGWSLYASGTTNGVQVARDGTVFQTTSGVQNIVYWNHNVWMQTSAGWFYYGGDALGGNWIPGPGDPAITTSIQQTDVTDTVATIIGTASGSWQISSSGQVVHSGVADSSTTGTVELLFWNSTVYRKTGTSWFLFNGAWVSAPVDPRTNSALGQSPSGTFVPNTTWLIVDATGAVWRMTGTSGSFTIVRSNLSVQSASNVVELLYYQSAVYQAKVSQTSVAFPGSGSFTDNSGNVWSIDSGGNILQNGSPVFGGSGTSEIAFDQTTNTIYGQDASSGNWYYYNPSDPNGFTGPVAAPTLQTGLLWSFWNNGVWSSVAGDPRLLGGTSPNNPVFSDDFTTLNLYNWRAPAAGQVWMPATWYDPFRDGSDADGVWETNPFNPATPFSNIYSASGGILSMRIDNTPAGFSSAVGGDAFIGGQLQTAPTFSRLFGYFECQVAVPKVNGTAWTMWMIDGSGQQEIDMIQIWTDQSHNQTGKFGIWDVQPSKTLNKFFFTYQMASPPDMTQMHTYGVYFDSSTVRFYIDRVQQAQFAMPTGYTQPMFIILAYIGAGDQSGGNPNPGSLPVLAQVDYVKVWSSLPF
jgi:hypothetical protein